MRAKSKRHDRVAGVANARLQSQSITYFVAYFQRERPRPDRTEIRIVRRIENRGDEVRSPTRHTKRALACEAVNRVTAGIIHRQRVFAALKRKASVGDAARPGKENRNAAAMRMLAPCVRIGRPGDDVERPRAVAETLASGSRHNHGPLALRLERDEFHGYGFSARNVRSARVRSGSRRFPRVVRVYFAARRGENYSRVLCASAELTNGRVRRRGVRRLHHRRHRQLRRCAPVLR